MTLQAKCVDEYHKHGCRFFGKLVVVDYMRDAQNDPRWGEFGAGVTMDYLDKARALVRERQYTVKRECLSIPDLVVEIE